MTVVPVSQTVLGFTGGVVTTMTAYSLVADQLRTDMRSLDHSLRRFRRTLEYGLPLFIRDEEFLQVMNALEMTARRQRQREKSLWQKVKQAGQWNWNAGLVGAVAAFHAWKQQ
ncbi:hypothetical protein BGZ98_005940 [Dissophora globulifera]|uniref:Uncharacterized protein n=1 Tax=Dissophora globulifera TaxID=979702 RepID=A0A9P6RXI5_9FUNG|nr:hypothetical protein BGZ98_005940 [Dissophora globulifera]KAG0330482.1 hypothetical protein BGZ99_003053 [Dissophora globulifera]